METNIENNIKRKKGNKIIIVVLCILLIGLISFGLYYYFTNIINETTPSKKYFGDWIYEDDQSYVILNISEDGSVKYKETSKKEEKEPTVYTSNYRIAQIKDSNKEKKIVLIVNDSKMGGSTIYLLGDNTLCFDNEECHNTRRYTKGVADYNYKYIPKEEENEEKETTPEEKNIPSSVIKSKSESFKETIKEAISYFGSEKNFDSKEEFNSYKKYVDRMKSADLSNYDEDNSKINMYIFRGGTCSYCLEELSYLATQIKDYGKYVNIRTYEVWGNDENNKLMKTIANMLGEDAGGVPFTVIGKKVFVGFSSSSGEKILNEIVNQYQSNDRYDVLKEIGKKEV